MLAAIVWTSGYATQKPTPDPLAGRKLIYSGQLHKIIVDDLQDYIQKLPPEEKYYVQGYNIRFFENETGDQAVRISIPLDGIWWEHVLIYDKDNKTIRG